VGRSRQAHPLREDPMDIDLATADRLLSTTRSVRKRLDLARPVDPALLERAIEIALQAPTGSNSQGWHFVVVTDAEKRARIGALYRRAFEAYANMPNAFRDTLAPDDPRARQLPRIIDSATYLANHLREVAELIGIPEHVTQAALLPVAHVKGADFKPAARLPAHQFTHWNAWGARR